MHASGRKGNLPMGIDKSILNEDEINRLLKITSEKSLAAIARETEMLAGEGFSHDGMMRGDMKVSMNEIEEFDAVEEAFKLLIGDNKQDYLTIDNFKTIFKNLSLGEIAPSDEDIFMEVAKSGGDKTSNKITL